MKNIDGNSWRQSVLCAANNDQLVRNIMMTTIQSASHSYSSNVRAFDKI